MKVTLWTSFDKVPHKRLIQKLKGKGINAEVIHRIESWLTGRTQRVCIEGNKSGECPVESGVPQGTVLGPILFSVFIEDLEVEVVRRQLEVVVTKFADDNKGAKLIRGPERQRETAGSTGLPGRMGENLGNGILRCKM